MPATGFTPIQLFHSTTAGTLPTTAQLFSGELFWNIADNKVYGLNSAGTALQTVVGTLGNQNANTVAITGGSFNGTPIGNTTPSTGSFTTLTASTSVLSPIIGAGNGSNLSLQANATTYATLATNGVFSVGGTVDQGAGISQFFDAPGRWCVTEYASNPSSGTYYFTIFKTASSNVGSITSNGTSTSYNTSSDPRLKNVIGVITPTQATNFVMALQPKYGTWKADGSSFIGFITTEYSTVDPSAVQGQANATQPIGNVTDSTGKILQTGVPQPAQLTTGETWTQTGTQDVYQSMEYGSSAWCANMTAFVQNLQNTITSMEAKLKAAGVAGF